MLTVIKNGRVIDPYNNVDSDLNIVVRNGKIVEVTHEDVSGDVIIDASDCIVSPGFIDIHMHEDLYDETRGQLENTIGKAMLSMGVTTCIGGNCGINTNDPVKYLHAVDVLKYPVNIGLLVGHANLRSIVGEFNKYQQVDKNSVAKMKYLAESYLADGCFGISFGIRYIPGINEDELLGVSSACEYSRKMVTAHVRNDAKYIVPATMELINIGRKLDIPIQNSHIGSMAGYGQMESLLKLLDEVKLSGVDISSDCYPYYAFSTGIGETTYDEGFLDRYNIDYTSIEIAEGKYKGQRCDKYIFEELRQFNPKTLTIGHVMSKKDIDMALLHPNVMLASDGLLHKGQGHPRATGTFTRYINSYVKNGMISLYDAINKMTTQQAIKLGLKNKGNLSVGSDADIVIFSYDEVKDNATFEEPTKPSSGIKYVMINGMLAIDDGKVINLKLGNSIRG